MTNREKFNAIAKSQLKNTVFLPYDLNVRWIMEETLDRWEKEGFPKGINPCEFFKFDKIKWVSYQPYDPVPAYDETIISEDNENIIKRNKKGAIVKIDKRHSESSMPFWLEHPIKSKEDFREYKKRFDWKTIERYPANWDEFIKTCNEMDCPVGLSAGSFYGHTLQQWIGTEPLCMMFYDDKSFIHEMMEFLEEFFLACMKKFIPRIKFDFASFGEDIAYKGKSFVSPAVFKEFIQPRYKRIVELLRNNGVEIIFVDSDGYIEELIPLWLESGINGFSPLEVAAGTDALRIKKKYGKEVILAGGIDKREIAVDKAAIDREIDKVKKVLSFGGYFPMIDHSAPPDISFDKYCYFVDKLKKI